MTIDLERLDRVRCRLLQPVSLASHNPDGSQNSVAGRAGDVLTMRRRDASTLLGAEPGCLEVLPPEVVS